MLTKTPNEICSDLWHKIPRNVKITFLAAFLVGLFTHMFVFTNVLLNHDGIWGLYLPDLGFGIFRGRGWFSHNVMAIRGIFTISWLIGLLSILYISISSCLVVSLLRTKEHIYCILIASIMVTMPSVASAFTYMTGTDSHFFALLLACYAAFIAERYKYGFLFAVIPIVLALAIYQIFFGVTAALMILVLILELLRNQTPLLKTFFKGVRFLGTLVAGMVLYLLSVRIIIPEGILDSYQGMDNMGQIPMSDLPAMVSNAYSTIITYFTLDFRNFHYSFLSTLFVFSFIACGILIVLICVKKRIHQEPLKLLLMIVLLLLFPLGCNIIYLYGADRAHDLMIYATVFMFVLLLVIVDLYRSLDEESDTGKHSSKSKNKLSKKRIQEQRFNKIASISSWIITITVAISVFNYWILSNQAYFKLNIEYQTTYAQSVLLISNIQRTPGYTYDKEIVLVGRPPYKFGIPELWYQPHGITLTGAHVPLFGCDAYTLFLKRFLNFTQPVTYLQHGVYSIADEGLVQFIMEMPVYPDDGSIVILDDAIIVNMAPPFG